MFKRSNIACAVALAVSASVAPSAFAGAEADAERIKLLEDQIKIFQEQLKELSESVEAKNEEADAQIEALTDTIEAQNAEADEQFEALADAVDEAGSSAGNGVTAGGYVEVILNERSGGDNAADNDPASQVDVQRFIFEFNKEITDRLRFGSEIEIEHTDTSRSGVVELEQAWIQYDFNENVSLTGGLILVPIGILNETHEPNTFFGAERNQVEAQIIPTTFREGGLLLTNRFDGGWQWDNFIHTGLGTREDSDTVSNANGPVGQPGFRIRNGRRDLSRAPTDDPAFTSRLKYTGIPGVELAGSIQYQSDLTQFDDDGLEDGVNYTGHVIYDKGIGFGVRALYSMWDLSGDDFVDANGANQQGIESAGVDEQTGWYIEPHYRFSEKFAVFARYEDIDADSASRMFDATTAGLSYWVHEDVVLKFDVFERNFDDSSRDFSGLNAALGWTY